MQQTDNFKDTVILVDADYVDSVAFDLTVNFERMLMRRIPVADLAQWLVCVGLDGGLSVDDTASRQIQVIFLHDEKKSALRYFAPGKIEDIDGKAFRDKLGEFLMSAVRKEPLAGNDLFVQCTEALLGSEAVKRIVLVPDMGQYGAALKQLLASVGRRKEVTLLAMQPEAGRGFQSEILGYSLMQAMGIRSEELI